MTHDPQAISIVPFRPDLAGAFASLNREWIERLFRLESSDLDVLRDPERLIIERGGQIFFALEAAAPIGTVAAIRAAPTVYELAKMAVSPSHQRRGIGARLGEVVVEWTRAVGAELVFLETNSGLTHAIRLYERLGFVQAPWPRPSDYARADVYMELRLQAEGV